MNEHKLNSDNHLTATQMQAYLAGEFAGAEMHSVEKHLLECGFCAEAIEGVEGMGDVSRFEEEVQELEKCIRQRTRKKESNKPVALYKKVLAVAAALALLVGASFLMHKLLQKSGVQNELAEKTEIETTTPKPSVKQKDYAVPPVAEAVIPVSESDAVAGPGEEGLQEETADVFYVVVEDLTAEVLVEEDTGRINENEILAETETGQLADADTEETLVDEIIVAEMEEEIQELSIAAETKSSRSQQYFREDLAYGTRKINGTVFSPDGSPLPFATVYAKDNGAATTTDENGRFELTVPAETQTLAVAFVGMATVEIEISETDTVTITLEDNSLAMREEVVVLVPGVKQKSGSSGTANLYYETAEPKPTIGKEQYKEYLKDSLRSPQEAINAKIKGKVILRLTIGMDGGIRQVSVVKGLGHGCDEEAIRLVKDGPRWLPGQKNGQVVEMNVKLKVKFR